MCWCAWCRRVQLVLVYFVRIHATIGLCEFSRNSKLIMSLVSVLLVSSKDETGRLAETALYATG